MQILNEPNIQNVSPNTNVIQQQQQPNQSSKTQPHATSTIQSPILKPSVLKDVSENRIQQIPSSAFSGQATVTPSLVVSVPLSTAGVNLPQNNNSVSSTINNNPAVHQGSGLYQQLSQNPRGDNTINPPPSSSSTLSSSLSSGNLRASPVVNFQQQNHHNNPVGRKSPLVQGAAMSPSIQQQQQQLHTHESIGINSGSSTVSSHNNSSVLQNMNQAVSQSISNNVSGVQTSSTANVSTTESGMLKITYDKSNSRIVHIQEDAPARRSRYVNSF